MPRAALQATAVDHVVDLGRIAPFLKRMCTVEEAYGTAG
jgi:hypothetical protein